MNNKQSLPNAGSVVVEYFEVLKANGPGIDLVPLVEYISIHEDIFSPFITGKAVIRDTLDLPNVLGRSGNDLVRLKIYTPSVDKKFHIEGYFFLYKLSERNVVKERTQLYTFYFSSVEMMSDINTHVSRQFKGTGDSIIRQMIGKYYEGSKKTLNADVPANQLTYVSNFWTPSKNFNYIAEHCVGSKGSSAFLFYENRDGFNLKEISGLTADEVKPIQTFSSSDYTSDVQTEGVKAGSVTRDVGKDYNNIHGVRVDTTYDFMKDYLDGAIKSKLYSVDPITKKIRWSLFDLTKLQVGENTNQLYKKDVVSGSDPIIMLKSRGYGTYGLSETSNYATLQRRTAYMRALQASKIEIDVYGRTDYTVGKKVTVNLNRLASIVRTSTNTEVLDRVYSGNYLITAIVHEISRASHKCTLELCKESTLLK